MRIFALTTALSTVLIASAALAENPKVTVGGFADFQAGWVDEDLDAGKRSVGFRNDTEVTIHVDGKTDQGLGYGAVIDLEADVTEDADGEGTNASRTYIYLDGGWGRFELGSNSGAEDALKVDASNIARATGGIDGDWRYFATQPGGGGGFLVKPDLPAAYGGSLFGDETRDNANKISYYSPRFSGLQLGLSYTPSLFDRGQTVNRFDSVNDIVSGGLNYEAQFNEVTLAAAVTGASGDTNGAEDLRAWNAGLQLGFAGFSVAASYGDWGDSLRANGLDVDYYTLGAAYDFGAFGASVTYLDSSFEAVGGDNDFSNLVIGADYKLAEGLTPYAEISFFDADAVGAVNDNEGTIFLIGTELAF